MTGLLMTGLLMTGLLMTGRLMTGTLAPGRLARRGFWSRPALVALLVLVSCRVHTVQDEVPPPIQVPEAFGATGGVAKVDRWWTDFGDEALDALVEDALAGNLDLAAAWARLDQVRALRAQTGAGRYPQVSLDGSYSYGRSVLPMGPPIGTIERETHQFNPSIGVAYELDLWGKIASLEAAAELDIQASRQDLEAMAMTLVAQLAETWFLLREQHAQRALLSRQLAVNETLRELVELRFGQGLASALDVYQQRQQVAATRAQLPLVDGQLQVLTHQLALLAGRPAVSAEAPTPTPSIPTPPPLPATGLPSELLQRRPDVRSAHLRVVSSDHRLGAVIADQYPTLRLSASAGITMDFVEMVSSWLYNLGAALTLPVFDGGRRSAAVDRARAARRELLAGFGKVVLTALNEVEDALVREHQQHAHLAVLEGQLTIARAALTEARSRYVNGLSDYLPVLTSLQSLQQLERSELSARRQALSYRIQLYRALGGSWTGALARPPEPAADEEESAE